MYVPLYRPEEPLTSVTQRLQALKGFVYSPYRLDDLMRGILGAANPNLSLRIYAGDTEQTEQLIFASRDAPTTGQAQYSKLVQLSLYGQTWTLRLESRPAFEQFFHTNKGLIAGLGSGLSALLFLLTFSLSLRRRRAEALAQQMTEEAMRMACETVANADRADIVIPMAGDPAGPVPAGLAPAPTLQCAGREIA